MVVVGVVVALLSVAVVADELLSVGAGLLVPDELAAVGAVLLVVALVELVRLAALAFGNTCIRSKAITDPIPSISNMPLKA